VRKDERRLLVALKLKLCLMKMKEKFRDWYFFYYSFHDEQVSEWVIWVGWKFLTTGICFYSCTLHDWLNLKNLFVLKPNVHDMRWKRITRNGILALLVPSFDDKWLT
jgi:hypothetical protein